LPLCELQTWHFSVLGTYEPGPVQDGRVGLHVDTLEDDGQEQNHWSSTIAGS
jgi:hypothetical protein